MGRGVEEERIAAEEYEAVFARLWHHARCQPYAVKTTEAPHYRRFVLQQGGDPLAGPGGRDDGARRRGHRAPLGVGDGKGVMFVGHTGEIYPGRLPAASVRPVSPPIPWSTSTRTIPRSVPSAIPTASWAAAASANTAMSAAAAGPGPMP